MAQEKEQGLLSRWWDITLDRLNIKPMETPEDAMLKAQAYVDPTRLFPTGLVTAYNPSELVMRRGMLTYDKMRRDEQVKKCLSFKKAAVLSSGWEIVSPGDMDDDWEVTEFVRQCFAHIPGGMTQALKKMLLALDYGVSVTEKVYGDAEWAEGKKVLSRLIAVKPHYIDFAEDQHGQLLYLIQRLAAAANPVLPMMPPGKFVVYTHEKEFENHYGRSDLEAAYRAWVIKENAYKWFAIFLERYGMAPVFAMYNPNSYQGAQVNNLRTMVTRLQSATAGVIPRVNKDDLEMWSQQISEASRGIFLGALNRFDADIASAILVPQLIGAGGGDSGDKGQQSQGSYARSKTHFDVFMLMIEEERALLADDALNNQLIPQLCDLNFPGLKEYPLFRFLPVEDEQKGELYKLWKELVGAGVVGRIPDDETHIRAALGMPENANPTIEPLPGSAAEAALNGEGDEEGDAEEVNEDEQTEDMKEFAENQGGVWVNAGGNVICVDRAAWRRAKKAA